MDKINDCDFLSYICNCKLSKIDKKYSKDCRENENCIIKKYQQQYNQVVQQNIALQTELRNEKI